MISLFKTKVPHQFLICCLLTTKRKADDMEDFNFDGW